MSIESVECIEVYANSDIYLCFFSVIIVAFVAVTCFHFIDLFMEFTAFATESERISKKNNNNNNGEKILVEMKANQVISVNLNESKSASN